MHNPVINGEQCMLLLKDMSIDYEFFSDDDSVQIKSYKK